MASAFAMLFFALFSNSGPVNNILLSMGVVGEAVRFMESTFGARTLVALMNFLMWFGNTTIMLMAAIMGINPSVFEAAELDGCTHLQAKNYGMAGALSVFLFIISGILCWIVFRMNTDPDPDGSRFAAKRARKGGRA